MNLTSPVVSIVIPVFNGASTLRPCLDSILACSGPDYEIIVVNDGSTDETASILETYPCRLITLRENKGRGFARNRAIEASRGPLILFTDADCIVGNDWVSAAVRAFHRLSQFDPAIAAVEGAVLPLPGFFNTCDAYSSYGYNQDSQARYTDHFCTANVIAAKAKLIEAGLFDESLPTFEDRDLGIRLQQKGHRLYYQPKITVRHNHTRRGLSGFLRHEYQWGRQVGNYFEIQYPDYHRTALTRFMRSRIFYAGTTPLFALAITAKIAARNMRENPRVAALAPFIFLSKLSYRLGALRFMTGRKEKSCAAT